MGFELLRSGRLKYPENDPMCKDGYNRVKTEAFLGLMVSVRYRFIGAYFVRALT